MTLLTLRRREPQVATREYSNEYADFMNSFVRAKQRYDQDCNSLPAVNIYEEPTRFVLEVAAPGYSKNDFNVSIEKEVLTISAEVKQEAESSRFTRCEFSRGSFRRRFTIGKSIDSSKVNATYSNGILTLILNKKEEAIEKPSRSIRVD